MRLAHALGCLVFACGFTAGAARAQGGYVFLQKCADTFLGLELAIDYCGRAIKSGDLSAENLAIAHYNRGASLSRRKAFDRAIADFDESIRLNPKPAAFVARGAVKGAKRDQDGAVADYSEAIRLETGLSEAYLYRGQALIRKGEFEQAIGDFTEALKLEPASLIVQGGTIMMYSPRPRTRERGANDTVAYFGRAVAQSLKQNHDAAIADLSKVLQIAPSMEALKLRGMSRFHRGDFAGAATDLANTWRANPSDTENAIWLFIARTRAGSAAGGPDARAELEGFSQKLAEGGWPRLITELFLAKATPEQVFAAVPETGTTRRALRCQASFFVGQWRMIKGERDQGATLLRRAKERCPGHFPEYLAAAAELMRLGSSAR